MVFEDSMFNVNESANESNSLNENPTMSDELDEDEVEHDPHDDEILFSRLLFGVMVWQVQRSDNGNANLNMPLLDNDI
jgi:hypothetical protein